MKHTFVICAYQQSEYLEECIVSLEKQTQKSAILIATSTPNTWIYSLADKHQIPVYVNEGESGIAGDWNFALSCAETPYVTIAHQDDIYLPEYSARVVQALDAQRAPIIGFTDYCEIRNGQQVTEIKLLKITRLMLLPLRSRLLQRWKWVRRRVLSMGSAICCPSVVYVREAFTLPLFQQHFRASVDWETWEVLSRQRGSFVYCSKVLMGHRIHADSETSAAIQEHVRTQEDYEMFCKFWPVWIARKLSGKYSRSEASNNL